MTSTPAQTYDTTVEVIFRDVDAMGHVNNAVYFTYMETARTRFFMNHLNLVRPGELPVIVAEANCSYKSAAWFGERLTIGLFVSRIGAKSFDLTYNITANDGRIIAIGKTIMVAYDYSAGKTIQIPPYLRDILVQYLSG